MTIHVIFGYLAAVLVFAAFFMRSMLSLRIVALCSNVAFLVYALGLDLIPIAVLHVALIPVNCWRLTELVRTRPSTAPQMTRQHG